MIDWSRPQNKKEVKDPSIKGFMCTIDLKLKCIDILVKGHGMVQISFVAKRVIHES